MGLTFQNILYGVPFFGIHKYTKYLFENRIIGWLTLNSKSVWPAVFLHGGINSIMIFLFEMDFGEHKFYANFAILGIWIIIGCLAYKFIYKK